MLLPLYGQNGAPSTFGFGKANAGLWYNKFCNEWEDHGKQWKLETRKRDWINSVTSTRDGKPTAVGDKGLIDEAVQRLTGLVSALRGQIRFYRTNGRFVAGLGYEHPVENGFTWHHTLGVPYLPGSSLKGTLRHWAEEWEKVENDVIARVFGPEDDDEKSVGSVIFFDALPSTLVQLEADVMTPHYGEYYQRGLAPGDWQSPNPIPILAVASKQSFVFSVAPRRISDGEDVAVVMKWLDSALTWTGVGAKTAVGYGRFEADALLQQTLEEEQRRQAREAAKATMSPVRREMEDDGYDGQPDRFMTELTNKWLKRMMSEETQLTERREIADLLAKWYQAHRPDQWLKPSGKNEAKVKQIKGVLDRP